MDPFTLTAEEAEVVAAYRDTLGWARTFQFEEREFNRHQYTALVAAHQVLLKQRQKVETTDG